MTMAKKTSCVRYVPLSGPEMDQDDAYSRLVAAIAEGAIAFVGAGSSAQVGFPAWGRLLSHLCDLAKNEYPDRHTEVNNIHSCKDPLTAAEECERILGRSRVRQVLMQLYGPEHVHINSFHRDLVHLSFAHLLTTNYDRVLETAYREVTGHSPDSLDLHVRELRERFLEHFQRRNVAPTIVHVHGSVGDADGTVLTLDDYNERYERQTWAKESLKSLFQVYPCVFIGFGLTDQDLMSLLRFMSAVLGNGTPKHFAVLPPHDPDDEDAEAPASVRLMLASRFRIEPIFYATPEQYADRFNLLGPFVARLRQDVERKRQENRRTSAEPVLRDVEAILDEHVALAPEVLAIIRDKVANVVSRHAVGERVGLAHRPSVAITGTDEETRTDLDVEIDQHFSFIQRGYPDVAIEWFTHTLNRQAHGLTDRLRYRLYANRGAGYYSKGMLKEAADDYLRAASLRSTRDAQGFEAMAHFLLGDTEKTVSLAEALCRSYPEFARAWWLRIQTVPKGTRFEDVEAMVPEAVRGDAEVAVALGGTAMEQELYEQAERYARLAVAVAISMQSGSGAARTWDALDAE